MERCLTLYIILFVLSVLFCRTAQPERDCAENTSDESRTARAARTVQWDDQLRIAHGAKRAVELDNGHIVSTRDHPSDATTAAHNPMKVNNAVSLGFKTSM